MSHDTDARLALLEKQAEKIPELEKEVAALKRFRVAVTTLWAATLGLLGFFGDPIRKKMGL